MVWPWFDLWPSVLKSCPGYYFDSIRCRRLILGRDISGCRCASWFDLFALSKCVHMHIWDIFLLWQRYIDCCKWLLYALLHNCAISIDSYSPNNKFYSFIFSLLINVVLLLLNSLILVLYLYIHFSLSEMWFSLLKYYLELFITDTALKVSGSFTVSSFTDSPLLYLMVLKTISPGCGVQASLMLFWNWCNSVSLCVRFLFVCLFVNISSVSRL